MPVFLPLAQTMQPLRLQHRGQFIMHLAQQGIGGEQHKAAPLTAQYRLFHRVANGGGKNSAAPGSGRSVGMATRAWRW